MGIWTDLPNDPGWRYGRLHGALRGMVCHNPTGQNAWCIVDYRDGLDRGVVIAEGEAGDPDLAVDGAEAAAKSYVRNPARRLLTGKPLTSTVRNRLRNERMAAKESAAALGVILLVELYDHLREANQPDWAQRVEIVLRKTALSAFASYCKRAIKILSRNSEDQAAQHRVEDLIAEMSQLGDSMEAGGVISRKFSEISNEMKVYGVIAEVSLVDAVHEACLLTVIPRPRRFSSAEVVNGLANGSIQKLSPAFANGQRAFNDHVQEENLFRQDLMQILTASALIRDNLIAIQLEPGP